MSILSYEAVDTLREYGPVHVATARADGAWPVQPQLLRAVIVALRR
ncbi:MAG: hypothetical protein ACLPLP_16380 [Mycobacterium sp.]